MSWVLPVVTPHKTIVLCWKASEAENTKPSVSCDLTQTKRDVSAVWLSTNISPFHRNSPA